MKQIRNVLCRIGGAILVFICSIVAALISSLMFAIKVLRGDATFKQMMTRLADGGNEMMDKYDVL